ncbi:hypothetical protein Droror1_Dr00028030 [Drosera rotundifolia]
MVKMRLMLVMKESKEGLECHCQGWLNLKGEVSQYLAWLTASMSSFATFDVMSYIFCAPQVVIGMDIAASEFYKDDKTYDLNFKEELDDRVVDAVMNKLLKNYKTFCKYLGRKHSLSEVFVTTQGGNFPHFLMGHRRYLNRRHAKTIMPDKKKLALIFDDPISGSFLLSR